MSDKRSLGWPQYGERMWQKSGHEGGVKKIVKLTLFFVFLKSEKWKKKFTSPKREDNWIYTAYESSNQATIIPNILVRANQSLDNARNRRL
ncbi:MAG: hypothetical protein L3J05_10450 [Robiginitomaculum sp.]|nr:hypothetical protein [Robiginitomaculum sp.]